MEKISVQQLLDMMGWKPEEKTTGLGGVMDAGIRPNRTPGGAKAAPKSPPGAEVPATDVPPAAGAPKKPGEADPVDPFGSK